MQKSLVAHETLSSIIEPSSVVIFHAFAPPVGLVDVTTSPCRVIATQNVTDGHDSAANESTAGTTEWLTFHALGSTVRLKGDDPVGPGWDEVITSPDVSAATQNEGLGHETAVSADEPGSSAEFP